jgi:DNA modification methylase
MFNLTEIAEPVNRSNTDKSEPSYEVLIGDNRQTLQNIPDGSIQSCITSPPYYGLRDYGMTGQTGNEETPQEFVQNLVQIFRQVRRVLRDDGTLWLNLGDSYVGRTNVGTLKAKELIGLPWLVALALQNDGWLLRQEIIWSKPNPMPESVKDRCTKSHEHIFLLTKSANYYFDHEAIKEPSVTKAKLRDKHGEGYQADYPKGDRVSKGERVWGGDKKNKRSVWTVPTAGFAGAHFATFPPALIEPCVLAGTPLGGVILDPFGGSGTTAAVAVRNGRNAILCELNPDYAAMVRGRVDDICLDKKQGEKRLGGKRKSTDLIKFQTRAKYQKLEFRWAA